MFETWRWRAKVFTHLEMLNTLQQRHHEVSCDMFHVLVHKPWVRSSRPRPFAHIKWFHHFGFFLLLLARFIKSSPNTKADDHKQKISAGFWGSVVVILWLITKHLKPQPEQTQTCRFTFKDGSALRLLLAVGLTNRRKKCFNGAPSSICDTHWAVSS